MGFYIIRRLVSALSVVLATLVATFALFFVAPTDPAGAICGERNCTTQRYQEIKANLHLDEPKVQQFARFVEGIVVGRDFETSGVVQHCSVPCLGFSFKNDQPVTGLLMTRLPVTVSLVLGQAAIVLTVGVAAGAMAARRRGTMGDRMLMSGALLVSAVPYYIVGLLAVLYLTVLHPILPRGGWTPPTHSLWKWFAGLVAPWVVQGLYGCTDYARFARGSMVETLSEDYIRTARAKGLADRTVTYKHALRAGLIPVITIFGLDIAGSLSGAIFTEKLFDLPGLGMLSLDSVNNYDLPLIMGTVLLATIFLVALNLVVDVTYSLIDPRVRLS
ncbi:ABC transporter permease subunit [Kribbella jejuensis]|uniref:Peptide/nickel transport system permease protein n=1 Tax=Kribbella jejuensis TaxID=236068 RepID=A0A542E7U6_9ACTN|nr:ABC transporter permease [Kribbella jejuensis]TQJ11394.1 peptide/nickel transport system permease protein [Kribbella jejuensis]